MTKYTHKDDKTLEKWMFHDSYFTQNTNFLPQSVQRELARRLTTCKEPLDQDELKELNPIIETKLEGICDAYGNKQARSRMASAKKRTPKQAAEESESESESESEDEEEPKHAEFEQFMIEFRQEQRKGKK